MKLYDLNSEAVRLAPRAFILPPLLPIESLSPFEVVGFEEPLHWFGSIVLLRLTFVASYRGSVDSLRCFIDSLSFVMSI